MKLFNFIIIRLTICLIVGTLIGHFIPFSLNVSIYVSVALTIILAIVFIIFRNSTRKSIWFGIIGFLTMTSIGALNTKLHDDKNIPNHYTNTHNLNNSLGNSVTFRVSELLKPSKYHFKYVVDILSIDSIKTHGKVLLNVTKESSKFNLKIDDIFFTKTKFSVINIPLNPYQFDYSNYLKKQHIYHQLYVDDFELFLVSNTKRSLFGYASSLREYIQSKLKQYNFSNDEYAVINALILGQRQDISKEMYDNYAQAGAIHILAVSGLHVGIILFLLNYLLKPIEFLRHGRYYKIGIIVLLLWCFAIVAGLSASVTRAVTMFTVIAIAMNLKRSTNIYNTLAISILILLLFKPSFLFDVGFQMSYLAVIAIVVIQPHLYKLYQPKYKLDNLFWNIFTVTLAAQFGVVPISLYYFHQFPGLFFLSNLVIIPFLGVILGFGIIVIGLSSFNLLPKFLADIYSWIISYMNGFVEWVSRQEAFLFQNISFNLLQTMLSYILITTTVLFLLRRNFKSVSLLLTFIILTQLYVINLSWINQNNEFIVFHKSRHTMLGFKQSENLLVNHNLSDSILNSDNIITNYKVGSHINHIAYDTIKNVYQIENKTLLIIDSLGVYKSLSFSAQILLLRNSPRINLSRLIDSLQPELIISDGSNYTSFQNRWQATCRVKKIPFHRTSEKGAYIYHY